MLDISIKPARLVLCLLLASALTGCRHDPGVDLLADLDSAELNGPKRSIRPAKLDNLGRVVTLQPGSSIGVSWEIPEGATLDLEYGFEKPESPPGAAVDFRVAVEIADESASRELRRESIARRLLFSSHRSVSIPLDDLAGKIARFTFGVAAVPGKPAPSRAYWKAAMRGLPAAPPAPIPARVARAGDPPNVIIYLIDALRADRLEPYGLTVPTSPRIKSFAEGAVVFENAYAHASWTRASVATIMTGVYPSAHLTEGRQDTLPQVLPTLPRLIRSSRHHSYAFVTQPNVGPQFGFGRDFDTYEMVSLRTSAKDPALHLQSDRLFDFIRQSMAAGLSTPALMYVHAVDTHDPYTPAPKFVDAPPGCDPRRREMYFPGKYKLDRYDDRQMACIEAIYDGAVRQSDYYFGLFLDLLKSSGMYENSIVILTADHGESFLEHGEWGHGKSLYEPEIRVPLIVRLPHGAHAGTRVRAVARHVDILPTILEVLELEQPRALPGASLLRLISAPPVRNAPVFSELELDRVRARTIVLDGYKLIETGASRRTRTEFYDLSKDAGEHQDLADGNPVRMAYMKRLLAEWGRDQKERGGALKRPASAAPDAETLELLRALGYVQ